MYTKHAYLTIDDSPSPYTNMLTDWLKERDIPAIFFCRGSLMKENISPIVEAIKKGFVMANHLYSHQRASELSFEQIIEEIEKTEDLINQAYQKANVKRPGKYIRFPHMDRGMGGWIIDYNTVPEIYKDFVIDMFADGIRITLEPPNDEMIEKKNKVHNWLKENGFTNPTKDINFAWYKCSEMNDTIDVMYTYSTSDWMLTKRHLGTKKYKNLEDLKRKIDNDMTLKETNSNHIILAHDDRENIFDVTTNLVSYLLEQNVSFIDI